MDFVRKRSRSLVSDSGESSEEEDITLIPDANTTAPSASTPEEPKLAGTKPSHKAYRPISSTETVIRCDLPPHKPTQFSSYELYERHCRKVHSHRCSACGLNFPDEHFLDLHISEKHDPLEDARRSRGEKTYRCLVPDCDKLCSDRRKRRLHCIDKHMFPRNYNFGIIEYGVDHRRSMLSTPRRRTSSNATAMSISTPENVPERAEDREEESDIEEEEEDDEDEDDEEEEHEQEQAKTTASNIEIKGEARPQDRPHPSPAPIKMHGRPGFLHFPPPQIRGQRGYRGGYRGRGGRGNRGGRGGHIGPATIQDPVSDITSSLSSLQFVPHSVMLKNKAKSTSS